MSSRHPTLTRGVSTVAVLALGAGALVGAASGTAAASTVADAAPASAPSARHSYPGSVPGFVATAPDAGPAADTTVEGEVYLPLKDEVGARALATAVSTPGTRFYGHPLTPNAWISTYSPSRVDLAAVEKYLTDSGLTISAVPTSRQYVVFRGPAPKMAAAFGTTLHSYRVAGMVVSAPAEAASLPASVARKVSGVTLGTSRAALTRPSNVKLDAASGRGTPRSAATTPRAVTAAQTPCSSYYRQYSVLRPTAYGRTSFPTYLCGYLPGQLRSAGELNKQINSGVDGTGQTVAIIDAYASPTIVRDTNDYMRAVGSPLLTRYREVVPAPSEFRDQKVCSGLSGWQAEEAIDVQSAHSVAPGAGTLYVGGFDCAGGLDVALSKILDSKLADIVSNSYGYPGEGVPDDLVRGGENLHIQAAGEGIGLYYSSGDSGDESLDPMVGHTSPDYPASSPFVTAVGGTSEAIAANGSYQGEVGWGNIRDAVKGTGYDTALPGQEYRGGAGGGVSALFAQPAYQRGVVPDALARSGQDSQPARVVPDIADLADPYTGFQIAIRPILDDVTLKTGALEFDTYGGTSLASPIAAAKVALVQAAGGRPVGFANPAFYATAKALPSGFHDVVPPPAPAALAFFTVNPKGIGVDYLVTLNQGLSLKTAAGYDTMTGVGSLRVAALSAFLARH